MNKSKITIEYDEACRMEQKKVPHKRTGGGRSFSYKSVKVNDPKCWEVITVENTVDYIPGHRLNEKQIKALCSNTKYDVQIGMPGQFRVTNSRY